MTSTALPMVLIWQLRKAMLMWSETCELMAFIALLLVLTRQLGMAIWMWFKTCELMAFIALLLVLTRQLGMVMLMRSEEHTSELQSLMRISYAVFCLKKKKKRQDIKTVV